MQNQNKAGQYPTILTKQALSMKDLLYGFQGNVYCGTPSGQDIFILPAWVANQSAGFGSSCLLTKLAIIIE